MHHLRVESNRNDKLIGKYRTGMLLFITGTAVGVSAAIYFTNLNRELLVDSIERQTKTVKAMVQRERSKTVEMDLLESRNLFLEDQNQKLWMEHAHILKKKGKYAVAKQEPPGKANGAEEIAAIQPLPAPLTETKAKAPKETKEKKRGFFSMFH